MRVLPVQTLLARLEQRLQLLTGGAQDLEERQRTLRATIAWSYELLSAQEQTLFERLGVFIGGFRIDAAEAVCDPGGELGGDVLDGIAALVRFAWELGDLVHSAELLEERLELARSVGDELEIVDSLRLLGGVVADQRQFERARTLLEESLRRARELQDARSLRAATNGLSYLYWRMGDYQQASVFGQEELALAREAGDKRWEGITLVNLGCARAELGDLANARLLLRDGLRVAYEVGDQISVQGALQWLGIVAVQESEPGRAANLLGASETLWQDHQHFISPEH